MTQAPSPHAKSPTSAPPPSAPPSRARRALRALQARAFTLSWLSYASYYLVRKNFAVVKTTLETDLGVSRDLLGTIDTSYLALYAIGQFLNGALGDRLGARRVIATGMLLASAAGFVMGFGQSATVFLVFYSLNGLFQSTGWSNNVKAMTPWFGSAQRGKIMGIWCTNYVVGGLVATALATFLLAHWGWRWAFFVPAAWVAAVGLMVLVFMVERPQDRGLPAIADADDPASGAAGGDDAPAGAQESAAPPRGWQLWHMLKVPALWSLGGSYFGLKLIRYSLLFWLPYYLEKGLHYGQEVSGYLSTTFEAGGIIGAISIGFVSDRYFSKNRARLISPVLFALAGALMLYEVVGSWGIVANGSAMALIGFLLFGPDALISSAAAQDIGGEEAAASAAGIINGLGSVGGALSGIATAKISEAYGWDQLFYVFVGMALLSAVALIPLALRGGTQRAR